MSAARRSASLALGSRLPRCLAAVCLAAGCFAVGCVDVYDGNGVPGEEVRGESGFDQISARGSLDVSVTQGAFGVRVAIDQNLIQRVRTFVDDDTLVIDIDGGNLGDHIDGPNVIVSMPTLRDVELNGSGRLAAEEFEEEEAVSVELAGRGELSWSGSTPALDVVLNGAGELTLTGEATSVDYYLAGAGTLDAEALTARGAKLEVQGSGSITATVDGRVDATIDGSGSIELFGSATEGTLDISDEGTLTGL